MQDNNKEQFLLMHFSYDLKYSLTFTNIVKHLKTFLHNEKKCK